MSRSTRSPGRLAALLPVAATLILGAVTQVEPGVRLMPGPAGVCAVPVAQGPYGVIVLWSFRSV